MPNASAATFAPIATPNAMPRNVTTAPDSRAVPDARWRVDSSVIAVVSVRPGINAIRPASVATYTEYGPVATLSAAASAETRKAASGSNTRRAAGNRPITSASTPTVEPSSAASAISEPPPPRKRAAAADDRPNAARVIQAA